MQKEFAERHYILFINCSWSSSFLMWAWWFFSIEFGDPTGPYKKRICPHKAAGSLLKNKFSLWKNIVGRVNPISWPMKDICLLQNTEVLFSVVISFVLQAAYFEGTKQESKYNHCAWSRKNTTRRKGKHCSHNIQQLIYLSYRPIRQLFFF